MTSAEILSMAREAGFFVRGETIRTMYSSGAWSGINDELAKFAELVTSDKLRRLHAANEALKAQLIKATTKPMTEREWAEYCLSHRTVDATDQFGEKVRGACHGIKP